MGKRKMCYLIALLMAGVMSLIGLAGCNTYGMYEDGYYVFVQNKDRAEAAKLTETGQQQEVLIVPAAHDGITVDQIGASARSLGNFTWTSKLLRKLYLPYSINTIYPYTLQSCHALHEIIIINCAPINTSYQDFSSLNNLKLYIPFDAYNDYIQYHSKKNSKLNQCFVKANISFLFNYENSPNNNYYWIDNVEIGEKLIEPQAPERNGYRFTGWYQDVNCTEEWNFEQEVDGESVTLYAGWIAL